jgi:hypothetical protein
VLYERGDKSTAATPATTVKMTLTSSRATFAISRADHGAARAWAVRLHLPLGRSVVKATVDGVDVTVHHHEPLGEGDAFAPFGGRGTRPAPLGGSVAEVAVARGAESRTIELLF